MQASLQRIVHHRFFHKVYTLQEIQSMEHFYALKLAPFTLQS